MRIRVQPVSSLRQMNQFIKYPFVLYRDDPYFAGHLISERRDFFSVSNPIFKFTDVSYFLALDESDKVVGRVTAHVNHNHNKISGERTGFFGFFECDERIETARALIQAAERWLRHRGMTAARGPFNFSTHEECGFLAHGFDSIPAFMMPYTKRCYLDFMGALGYRPVKDLLAYDCSTSNGTIPEYLVRIAERVRARSGVVVRSLNMNRFTEEVAAAFRVYNSAWEKNWGFIPMTEDEFRYTAKGLKQIIDPAVALLAEKDGRPIGFSLGLPDYNPIFKKMKGRLFPFGLLRFLLGRRSIHRIRVITMGVIEEYRKSGVDTLLIHDTFRNGLAKGYTSCEMSWVLEDNLIARRTFERCGAEVYKVYRIFEKPL